MSIATTEKSRIRIFEDEDDYLIERSRDIIFDHIDDFHVRIKKLFPKCHSSKELSMESYKRFHMRVYLPLAIFQDKHKQVENCFIMFNGLDELGFYTLYDQLGKGLCKNNYGVILLPLPDHLNRNMMYRKNDVNAKQMPSSSFINEPNKIYDAFIQQINEVSILIDHILGKCEYNAFKDCCSFFNHFFSPTTKISLLGFSLGGLAALSNFLIQNYDFNSCILLNSGAKLDDIDVSEFQSLEEWQKTVDHLREALSSMPKTNESQKYFDMVFLGNNLSILRKELKEKSRKLLFILGGADTVANYSSITEIEPKGHGLATLKLPGIHHFLSIDTHWDQWFPVVNETIKVLNESASFETLLPNDILHTLLYFQSTYRISKRIDHIQLRNMVGKNEESSLARTLYAAKATFGKISVAFIEMYKLLNKAAKKPHLYPDYNIIQQQENYFGNIAVNKFHISQNNISKTLESQLVYAKAGEIVPLFGELLLQNNILNEDQVNEILEIQKNKFRKNNKPIEVRP